MHATTLHARDTYADAVSGRGEPHSTHERPALQVGDRVEVEIGNVAHGGHCVARVGELVAFVRHALPGERVVIRITEVRSRFVRAETVEVITAHPRRRAPLCPVSGSCGGCDFQHASDSLQRDLKVQVLREALMHQGRVAASQVEELLGEGIIDLGLHGGWRSRMRYRTFPSPNGHPSLGLHRFRSNELVDATMCTIADPVGHEAATREARGLDPGSDVLMATGLDGPVISLADNGMGLVRHRLRIGDEHVDFHIPVDGFWQVHPELAQAIVDYVLEIAAPQEGQTWWDLYAGAGPIAAGLAHRVGPSGRIVAVEGSKQSVASGIQALHRMPWVRWHRAEVGRWLSQAAASERAPHGVVLDPPRNGAGAQVLRDVVAQRPRVVVIVACDPIALARDTALLADGGYRLRNVRVWDAFPQTHHMETLAAFEPGDRIS